MKKRKSLRNTLPNHYNHLMSEAVLSPIVQVAIAVDGRGKWNTHSLELLSDARAVASRLNGCVGAWVLTPPSHPALDYDELAAHGCRHVWHLKNHRFAGWSSEAIVAALANHRAAGCRLILVPGTSRGEEVAALLAEKIDSIWVADALSFSTTRNGALEVTAVLPGGKLSQPFRILPRNPPVITMRQGVAEIRRVKAESLAVIQEEIDLANAPVQTTVEKFIPADPRTVDLSVATRIVSAGRGAGGPAGVELVSRLADALHASLGASRMAVDLGWIPQPRQVGQTGRTVKPDLYVACGISGATHHLAGMRDSKHIIAINADPNAPIHEVAHLSLRGDLQQLIPAIIAALEKRSVLQHQGRGAA